MRVIGVLLVLLLLALAWTLLNPDYREQLQELSSDAGLTKKTTRVYKWRNAAGEWQLTDQQPAAGIEYERLDYREDVNVLPLPPGLATE
jgi:hypothetical protein